MVQITAILIYMAFVALGRATLAVAQALPAVASVDLNTIRAENLDFTLLELKRNVPGCYLGLEEAVNGTLDSGEFAGWTDITSRNDQPYIAPNQELILLYTYFLTADRPWNQ